MWYNYGVIDMEFLELFDINEKPVGKKIVRGNTPLDGEYIMVVYIFIMNNEKKILLEQNVVTLAWVVPGGHVNSSSPKNNIVRECKEELGIDINPKKLKEIETIKKDFRLFKIYYLKEDININSVVTQKEEVKCAKYFSIDEINSMIENGRFRENNVILIESLKKYLHI